MRSLVWPKISVPKKPWKHWVFKAFCYFGKIHLKQILTQNFLNAQNLPVWDDGLFGCVLILTQKFYVNLSQKLEHTITLKMLKTVFRPCFCVKKSPLVAVLPILEPSKGILCVFLKNMEPTSKRLNPGGSKYSRNSTCPGMFFDVIGTYVNIRHRLFLHWHGQVFWRW